MKFANDRVVDDQRVHKVIGKVVEADAPRFFSDFCGPRMIDVVGGSVSCNKCGKPRNLPLTPSREH